jgi:hypothetical protein
MVKGFDDRGPSVLLEIYHYWRGTYYICDVIVRNFLDTKHFLDLSSFLLLHFWKQDDALLIIPEVEKNMRDNLILFFINQL